MAVGQTKLDRWKAALDARDIKREEVRHKIYGGSPVVAPAPPAAVGGRFIPTGGQKMVQRGTRPVPLTHTQASTTTAKSWATRKQKFGKVGRQSKNTFKGKSNDV